jgi:hypothetical protein
VSVPKVSVLVALTSLATLTIFTTSVTTSGAATRRMSPLQVADFALICASKNKGAKVTTYFDIRCAADHSSNISVRTGVVGGPTEFPTYSSIGFLLDSLTREYTCYAYPDKVGARPVNITRDCPLWIIPKEYAKTNYPSAYSITAAFPPSTTSPPPTLAQVQSVASDARGKPAASTKSGTVFASGITPVSTFLLSYASGIGRNWCVWFYNRTDASGQSQTESLISPPGMYGTC